MTSLDRRSEDLQQWVGRTRGPVFAPGPIVWTDVRRYLNATGDTNPRWRAGAGGNARAGAPVPPAMIFDVLRPYAGQDAVDESGDRPFPSLAGLAGTIRVPGEVARLNVSTEVEWVRPLRLGDWLKVHFTITAITAGRTRLGPGVFIAEARRCVDQQGELVAVIRQTTARVITGEAG